MSDLCYYSSTAAHLHKGLHTAALSMWDVWRLTRHLSHSLSLSHRLNCWARFGQAVPVYSPDCWVLGLLIERLHSVTPFSDLPSPKGHLCLSLPLGFFTLPVTIIKQVKECTNKGQAYTGSNTWQRERQTWIRMGVCLAYRVLYLWIYESDQGIVCVSELLRGLNPHWVKLQAFTDHLGECTV